MAPKLPNWRVVAASSAIVGLGVGGFAVARAADSGDPPRLRPVELSETRDRDGSPAASVASLDSPAVIAPDPVPAPPPPTAAPRAPAPPPPAPAPAPVHDSPFDSWSAASPASADSVDNT